MGQSRDIKEVAAAAGTPPPPFRDIERLRRTTDSQRHFTLLCYPPFFFNDDGEPLFSGDWARLRGPLEWLMGEHLQAACFSAHMGEATYVELRMLGSLDKEPYQLSEELRQRLNQIPAALEPFRQVASPFARNAEGTGLGLALVKSLIECHDGRLEIESALHKGTTVRLVLPPERTVRRRTALSA